MPFMDTRRLSLTCSARSLNSSLLASPSMTFPFTNVSRRTLLFQVSKPQRNGFCGINDWVTLVNATCMMPTSMLKECLNFNIWAVFWTCVPHAFEQSKRRNPQARTPLEPLRSLNKDFPSTSLSQELGQRMRSTPSLLGPRFERNLMENPIKAQHPPLLKTVLRRTLLPRIAGMLFPAGLSYVTMGIVKT